MFYTQPMWKIALFNANISVQRKTKHFHKINIYLPITIVSQLSSPLSILQIKSTENKSTKPFYFVQVHWQLLDLFSDRQSFVAYM